MNACGPNGFFIRVETEEEDKSKQKRSIKGFFKAESDACIVVDDEEQPNSKKAKVDAAEDKKKAEAGESEPQSELKEKKRNASNDDSLRKFKDEWLGAATIAANGASMSKAKACIASGAKTLT